MTSLERRVAVDAARAAGRLLVDEISGARRIAYKGSPTNLVTEMDQRAEALILERLRGAFPDDAILAEEQGAAAGRSDRRWIVDPLDGTTNYAHGVPHFAVNVGVADDDGLAAGATYDPLRDELFVAGRGEGAFLNGTRLRHSGCESLTRALLVTGFPYDIHQHHELPLRLFGAFMRRARAVRRFGSAALDLAWVAAGRFDGFWEQKLKPWDLAPGILIAREAGAIVTDLDGGDEMLASGDIVAGGPGLVPLVLEVVREARAFRP
jgi:myo-inositol-1(or 4)-monophosphatase